MSETGAADPSTDDASDDDSQDDGEGSDDGIDSFLRAAAHVPVTSHEPERDGELLGPYRLGRKLGQGGMGTVYAAEDQRLGRTVAVKVLRRHAAADASARRRLLQEARAASRVAHPAIATVFEVGEHAGEAFVAMELIEGTTLRTWMGTAAQSVADTLRIGIEVARALGAAHRARVVHRDLKPENVMIRPDGAVRVLDFGLAKRTAGPPGEASVGVGETSADRAVGTPHYMSPEQAKGEPVGPATDVFALGVLLYEMLGGRRPFSGSTAMAVAIAIDRDEPPPLSRLRPDVPPDLERLVRRCLAKSPDARFASGDEVADALAQVGAGGRSRWHRPAAIAALITVVAALLALQGSPRMARTEAPSTSSALAADVPRGPEGDPPERAPREPLALPAPISAPSPSTAASSSPTSVPAGARRPATERERSLPAPSSAAAAAATIDPLARQK